MPSLERLCCFGSRQLMWGTLFSRNNQLDAQIRVNMFLPWASQRSVKECVMISAHLTGGVGDVKCVRNMQVVFGWFQWCLREASCHSLFAFAFQWMFGSMMKMLLEIGSSWSGRLDSTIQICMHVCLCMCYLVISIRSAGFLSSLLLP